MTDQDRQLVATRSAAGLSRLGTAGQRSYELISQWVRRQLGPEHAAIFGEPIASDGGEQVDWYTELAGPVIALADLSPEQQDRVKDRLAERLDQIRDKAAALQSSADANTQRLAEALTNALTIPGPDAVFAVRTGPGDADLQPVVVDWASVRAEHGGVGNKLLTGWTPGRPPPPPVSSPAVPTEANVVPASTTAVVAGDRGRWLASFGWLIVALLTALILFLLIAPCGLRGPAFLNFCAAAPSRSSELDNLARDRSVLENRIAALEAEINQSRQMCRPLPMPEDQATAPPDELEERLERENARSGEVDISLIWNSRADLDLHVRCPSGDRINFANKVSAACGGRLDVDMNVGGNRHDDPVEHVFFDNPAPGTYQISVSFFDAAVFGGSHPFTVRLSFGDDVQEFSGVLDRANPDWTTTYEYTP